MVSLIDTVKHEGGKRRKKTLVTHNNNRENTNLWSCQHTSQTNKQVKPSIQDKSSVVIESALFLKAQGWVPLWVPSGSKNPGRVGWQDERLDEGGIRRKFVNGGNLGIIKGSHFFRDVTALNAASGDAGDAELAAGWLKGKRHPVTGEALRTERLSLPPGSIVCCNTQ